MSKKIASRYIPSGFVQVFVDNAGNAIYIRDRENGGMVEIMAFAGNGKNHLYQYILKDRTAADKKSAETQVMWKDNAAHKEKEKAKLKLAMSLIVNKYKVGDILYRSWGYDQTNIDYYQVVKTLPKSVVVRAISDRMVGGRDDMAMSGRSEPVADSFLKESTPVMKKLRPDGFVTGLADHVPGTTHYVSWYA